jgi:hypothetical protein
MTEEHDTTTLYVSTDGEELSFAQVAMASQKDPNVTVGDHPEGYLVNGVVFRPADDDENRPQ